MSHNSRPHRLKVCLLSPHPLVRSEFERVLPEAAFQISFRPLAQSSPSEVKQMAIPKAPVYVIDGQASPHVLHALMETILERYPKARVLVLASKHSDAGTFDLLKLGVKGLLAYGQAEKQWQDALPLVAAGGYGCRGRCFRVSWNRLSRRVSPECPATRL